MSHSTRKPPCSAIESRPGCIQSALAILGDKWSPLLLGQLVADQMTFGELETALTGISPRTLSARLSKLQQDGIVQKQRYCDHPPRYNYSLTPKGNELREILIQMAQWGEKHHAPALANVSQ